MNAIKALTPLGRTGMPEDIGLIAAFLASDEARWLTGEIIFGSGGLRRPQGLAGPLAASKLMRAAIPDLRCEIEQMIVTGDRVVTHLRFRGHFTGRFGQIQGQGQTINFIATDIYRISDGRVAENWHIEDNLTLQQQLGRIAE
jgi:predicted ester cyclase